MVSVIDADGLLLNNTCPLNMWWPPTANFTRARLPVTLECGISLDPSGSNIKWADLGWLVDVQVIQQGSSEIAVLTLNLINPCTTDPDIIALDPWCLTLIDYLYDLSVSESVPGA